MSKHGINFGATVRGKSQDARMLGREAEAVDSLVAPAFRDLPQHTGPLEHLNACSFQGLLQRILFFFLVGFLGDGGGLASPARLRILRVPAQSRFSVTKYKCPLRTVVRRQGQALLTRPPSVFGSAA